MRSEREKLNLAAHGAAWEREGVDGWGGEGNGFCTLSPQPGNIYSDRKAGDVALCVYSFFRNIDDLCDITK